MFFKKITLLISSLSCKFGNMHVKGLLSFIFVFTNLPLAQYVLFLKPAFQNCYFGLYRYTSSYTVLCTKKHCSFSPQICRVGPSWKCRRFHPRRPCRLHLFHVSGDAASLESRWNGVPTMPKRAPVNHVLTPASAISSATSFSAARHYLGESRQFDVHAAT